MQLATAAGTFDTGANYDYIALSDVNTTITGGAPGIAGTSALIGGIPGTGAAAGALGQFRIVIENADAGQSTLRKAYHFKGGYFSADSAAGSVYQEGSGQWRDTTHAVFGVKLILSAGNFSVVRATVRGEP